jgi:Bacterial mobilisation protein (MobC)
MEPNDQTPSPFSLRLSFEERAQLERDAAGLSLGAYVRSRIFDSTNPAPRHRGKFPVKDQEALASVLAMLGQSRLGNNLNQLARAANLGTLEVSPDTEAALKAACRDIASIRHMLMVALGLIETTSGASDSGTLHGQFRTSLSGSNGESERPTLPIYGRYNAPRNKPKPPSL